MISRMSAANLASLALRRTGEDDDPASAWSRSPVVQAGAVSQPPTPTGKASAGDTETIHLLQNSCWEIRTLTFQLFKGRLGYLGWVSNPKPANFDDFLGDKLRDGVAATF